MAIAARNRQESRRVQEEIIGRAVEMPGNQKATAPPNITARSSRLGSSGVGMEGARR